MMYELMASVGALGIVVFVCWMAFAVWDARQSWKARRRDNSR